MLLACNVSIYTITHGLTECLIYCHGILNSIVSDQEIDCITNEVATVGSCS